MTTGPPRSQVRDSADFTEVTQLFASAVQDFGNRFWDTSDAEFLCAQSAAERTSKVNRPSRFGGSGVVRIAHAYGFFPTLGVPSEPHFSEIQSIAVRERDNNHTPILDYFLTPVGAVIGTLVLEESSGQFINIPAWEADAPKGALVVPFSDRYFADQRNLEDGMRHSDLMETLKKEAPEIVGKKMAEDLRQSRYQF